MSDPVNLRQRRKRQRRAEAERAADENRVRFGRSGGERRMSEALKTLDERRHEGHLRIARPDGKTSGDG